MGANFSASVSKFNQDVSSQVANTATCNASCSDSIVNTDVKFKSWSIGCPVSLTNKCTSKAGCSISSQVKQTADALNSFTNKQKASYLPGYNVSFNATEYSQAINSVVSNTCTSNADSTALIKGTQIEMDGACIFSPVSLLNVSDVSAQCSITAVTDMLAKASNDVTNDQSGSDLLPGLGDVLKYLVIAVVVVAVIGVVMGAFAFVFKKKDTTGANGSNGQQMQRIGGGGRGFLPTSLPQAVGKYVPRGNALPILPSDGGQLIEQGGGGGYYLTEGGEDPSGGGADGDYYGVD